MCIICYITRRSELAGIGRPLTLTPLQATKVSMGSPLQVTFVDHRGSPPQATKVNWAVRVNYHFALQRVKQQKVIQMDEVKSQFLPFNLNPALSLFVNCSSHFAMVFFGFVLFFKVSKASWATITIKAQPSTSSGLPASLQLAVTVIVILNDCPPENQFTADSDSGEEIDARVESSFTQVT